MRWAQVCAQQMGRNKPGNTHDYENQAQKFTNSLCHLRDPPVKRFRNRNERVLPNRRTPESSSRECLKTRGLYTKRLSPAQGFSAKVFFPAADLFRVQALACAWKRQTNGALIKLSTHFLGRGSPRRGEMFIEPAEPPFARSRGAKC